MIQANDFISKLRLEPDSVLKQMADMHQNDPYLFPMIFQESQARKDARAQAQAQQMGQQPLTTKEQDLQQIAALDQPQPQMNQPAPPAGNMPQAPNTPSGMPLQGPGSGAQMLPEEQGIGALPAKNMQRMAGGGITGAHHYNGNGPEQYVHTTNGGKSWYLDVPDTIQDPSVPHYRQIPNPLGTLNYREFPSRQEAMDAYTAKLAKTPGITNLLAPEQPSALQNKANLSIPPVGPAITNLNGTGSTDTGSTDTGSTDTGANNNKAPWSPPLIVAPTLKASGVPLGKMPTAEDAKNQANTFYNPAGIQNLLQENVTERGVLNTQNAVALDNMIKARPNLGGDYEKRLKEQEAKAPEEKENLKGMSLLEAGLAIMGGDSPYAAQNIARGVAGVKSYKEGLKDLQKAQDLRDQAFAHIDDMRKAQTIGDQNLAYTSTVQANDKLMDAKEHAASGYANALGTSAQIGANIFDRTTSNFFADRRANAEISARTSEANARLGLDAARMNQPPEAIRTAQFLGEGNVQTGYDMGVAKQHATELYTKWGQLAYPNGNMGQPNEAFIKRYPSPLAYVQEGLESAGFGKTGSGGFTSDLPKNATVLQAPTK